MSKSVKLILLLALVLGVLFAFFVFSRGEREFAEPVLSSGPVLLPETEGRSAYQAGYDVGYRAFMIQVGREVEPVVRYAALHDSLSPEDREEMGRGYVDGYHRAADSYVCPRCPY